MKLVDISVDNWENLLTLSTVFCVMLFINCLSTETVDKYCIMVEF